MSASTILERQKTPPLNDEQLREIDPEAPDSRRGPAETVLSLEEDFDEDDTAEDDDAGYDDDTYDDDDSLEDDDLYDEGEN
jgi:hypothetical protein